MPLPLFLGIGAAVGAAIGVGTSVHGAVKMKSANDTMKNAKTRHEANLKHFELCNERTTKSMDKLGKLELEILDSFKTFSDVIERIQNRPEFKAYEKSGVKLPQYDPEKLREVSIGAGVLLGGLGGATLGTAGGFAAAGATTSAVMALGTASTGTAIASLHGAALTNATLAALGGGSLAAGGGGIALGTTILNATTFGAGLMVGGIIFSFAGSKLSNKADEAWKQMKTAESQVDKTCRYLESLDVLAAQYTESLQQVEKVYRKHLDGLTAIIELIGKTDWFYFTEAEKKLTENTVLLVGLLYNMCKVELVKKSTATNSLNEINSIAAKRIMADTQRVLKDNELI